jgi:spermidine synthase
LSKFWFYEKHTPGYGVRWKIKDILHSETTDFQELAVVETEEFGKALILDGNIQVTEMDEFVYHEMLVHVSMNSHPHPEKILIIGGGDGGTAREVLKHQSVKTVDLVEIDERVVANCKSYLPSIACAYNDPRLHLHIEDGLKFVKSETRQYDLVLVDSSDPIGPAVQLYSRDFYGDIFKQLKEDGMLAVQSESPVFYQDIFVNVYKNLNEIFKVTKVYLAPIATYTSGFWSFTAASKKYDPETIAHDKERINGLKYYNYNVHKGAFLLPQFIIDSLK